MSFTYALGWTLLHSLWQGLILAVVAIIALRLIPSRYSSARYLVSATSLAFMLVAAVCTFARLITLPGAKVSDASRVLQATSVDTYLWLAAEHTPSAPSVSALDVFYSFIQSNLQVITLAWVVGVLFFSLRIAGGFWYLSRIRGNAMPVGDVWTERLQQLCIRMGLSSPVGLAESAEVQSPLVIGYFKPLILIPMGMIGGLSTEQLETILLHELSHIRRADYLVNIIQSFIEAVFFFNPFVWIVSSMVRTEREHCCDDAVVRHGHALTYAQALATVETLRFSNTNLAMSLASDKNQLLKRIKRIMEKSVQHYSVRERIVPVVLLVVGLACASWMTLKPQQQKNTDEQSSGAMMIASDTTKPGVRSYSRQIIRFDDEGNPHKVVIERDENGERHQEFELDEDFDMEDIDIDVPEFEGFDMPMAIAVPSFDFQEPFAPMEPMEALESMEIDIAPMPPMDITLMAPMPPVKVWGVDTLTPPGVHTYTYHYGGNGSNTDWESFSAEFGERFSQQFADFYKEHGKEMESMMKEMAKEYERNAKAYAHNFDYSAMDTQMREMSKRYEEQAREYAERGRAMADQQREAHERIRENIEQTRAMNDREVRKINEQARVIENNMRKFQEAVKAELVKDGYLKENESIKSIQWEDTGDNIVINGKKIKDSDKAKYKSIHEKFFKKNDSHVVEE